MFKHLKKYNETLFLMIVFLLFSGFVLFFNYGMSSRILLLKKESQKILQPMSEISQKIDDIIIIKKQLEDDITSLKNNQDNLNKPEIISEDKNSVNLDNKITLAQNSDKVKILDKLKIYKDTLNELNTIIEKTNSDEKNYNSFSVGNLPEGSLRNSIHLALLEIFKRNNTLISKLDLNNDDLVTNFVYYNTDFEQIPVLFKTNSESIKKLFDDRIISITKEINIIQITSSLGIASLFFVLIVIIFGKLIKTDESIDIVTQENANILKC